MKRGHEDAHLSKEALKEMDKAWRRWRETKEELATGRIKSSNVVVDAYLAYAELMRKYVDPSWS